MTPELATACLAALAHPSRLAIHRLLVKAGDQGQTAGELAQALEISEPNFTFHIKELTAAGLVLRQREGRHVRYRLAFTTMNQLLLFLTENCCGQSAEHCFAPFVCEPSAQFVELK
jgi:ArsR family transcriptional regulator